MMPFSVFSNRARSKGQAATEYLILLAIVLIVSISVIGTFIDMSSVVGSLGSRTVRWFWKDADIAITAHTVYHNGTGVFIIRNNKGYTITIDRIAIGKNEYEVGETIYPGRSRTVSIDGIETGNAGAYYSKKIMLLMPILKF